jgi:hypothetical protein
MSNEIEKCKIFSIDFFMFWPIVICKNIMKMYFSNDMVEVQTWVPLKNNMMPLPYSTPCNVFSPYNKIRCMQLGITDLKSLFNA